MRAVRILLAILVLIVAVPLCAQQLPDSPTPQADRPAFPAPNPAVPSRPVPATGEKPQAEPAPSQQDPQQDPVKGPETAQPPAPAPNPNIKTVPQGGATKVAPNGGEELAGTISKSVNFVLVPVTVKDDSGRLVAGLTANNFALYENGEKQNMRFFTSDPFAISAALVIDVGMPDIALEKIRQTFPAWQGAFSAYDELAVYTYGNTVKLQQDFVGSQSDKVMTAFKHASEIRGRNSGPMISDSPMTAGPSVNGRPMDPAAPNPITRSRMNDEPSRVLNDAILRAAMDLSRRDRTRRKMIFVVSDGREQGSTASYSDVLKVLLSNEVAVYSIAVDASAIPGYNKIGRIRFPRQGTGNILPKYSSATGGEVYSEFSQDSIEDAYARVTEQARNQYTIGYASPSSAAGTYRSIEVRVNRSGLKVYARDGYYPLPPSRNR
jgi:VWFA-related protein